ncbi:MAG: CotH kinase family protein [Burkholderiales bacterium]
MTIRRRLPVTGFVLGFAMSALATAADFNGDGRSDILWRNPSTGEDAIWQMNGASLAASAFIPTVGDSNWRMVGIGDFDASGRTDILWRNAVTGDNAIWLIDGVALADSALLFAVTDTEWKVAGVADFNGDGRADILWRNANTGDNAIWLMNGINVSSTALIPGVGDTNWAVIGTGDFNGDGKGDILWRNVSTGDAAVWLMNGVALADSALILAVPDTDWKIAGIGDFNGDGKADILWRHASTGQNAIWLMNGVTTSRPALIVGVPDSNWTIVGSGDYNGDGKADILWRHAVTGENAVWLMNGAALSSAALTVTLADLNWKPASNIPITPVSVLASQEAAAVRDHPAAYAVEENRVLQAAVVTYDGQYTFADVNADIDNTDAVQPEVAAHFVIEGYAEDGAQTNATLRLRGASTRLAEQKSYRIRLAGSAARWRGERTLQFNKHPYDLTRMRNKLAFDLFRDIPHMPSLRTQFVAMSITNRNAAGTTYATGDYGLFTHVEKWGPEYFTNRGLPTDGNIYKAENFDFRLEAGLAIDGTGKPVNVDEFEKVLELEADNGNHQKLIAMLTELNDPNSNFDAVFAKYFDKSNYLTWLASNILMGNHDTINQNFALYQPKGGDKFYFMPWDYDAAFGFQDQPNEKADGPAYSPLSRMLGNWWDVPLHKRFLRDPKHLNELKQAVDEVRDAWLTEAKIKAKTDRYLALVQPFVTSLPDSEFLPTVSSSLLTEWANETARIAKVVKEHRDLFFATLEVPMPFWLDVEWQAGAVRLNWDAAFDLQGDPVTYNAFVSSSPDFQTIHQQLVGTSQTTWTIAKPSNGIWYMKVTAQDNKGNTQIAFDEFTDASDNNHFGVLAFQVTDTGVIRLD